MHPRRGAALLAAVLLSAGLVFQGSLCAQAEAQAYPTMAATPDPRDFFGRADTHLTLLGDPLRFAGANIGWLGLRSDSGAPGDTRIPTAFEVGDALAMVKAIGGTVVHAGTLGASIGCPQCLMSSPGHPNEAAFTHVDHVLSLARDSGLKLIIPLAGGSQDCTRPDPYDGSLCVFVRAHGGTDARLFFTDLAIRADFLRTVTAIVTHVSSITGLSYAEDPTIMAWENCEGCGAGVDPAALAAWSEAVGQAIHAADPRHLYENGAFAGRIDPASPAAAPASAWATASVDIVGDTLPPGPDVAAAAVAASRADRPYVVDSFAWSAATWRTQADLESFLDSMAHQRLVAGALVAGLEAHADGGGYLRAQPGQAALYFPGIDTRGTTAADMQARSRAIRRFAYRMAEIPTPPFLMPPKPEIIAAFHGRLTWRGAAGALAYRIERSTDLISIGSWQVVCDSCTDTAGPWQDPHPIAAPVWYRVIPLDANGHAAWPSPPFPNS